MPLIVFTVFGIMVVGDSNGFAYWFQYLG